MRVTFNEIFSVFIHLSGTVPIGLQTFTNDKINNVHLHANKQKNSKFWTDVKEEQGIKTVIIVISNVLLLLRYLFICIKNRKFGFFINQFSFQKCLHTATFCMFHEGFYSVLHLIVLLELSIHLSVT